MDRIKISGLEFFAHHGVLQSEKELGQVFSIDCEFTLDTSLCGDNLEKTINYGDVSLDIVAFCRENRYDLLESLSNELSRHLLTKYELMKTLSLTVHKPHAPIATKFSDVSLSITRGWKTCYLAIGSNLGNRQGYLDMVSDAIGEDDGIREISKSSYIETEPYGVLDQPRFLNGAVKVETIFTCRELLRFCKGVEKRAGRTVTRRWGERTLDVDILLYGDEKISCPDLIIPHPGLHKRDFVLKPLAEIDPFLIHPVMGKSVEQLLKELG